MPAAFGMRRKRTRIDSIVRDCSDFGRIFSIPSRRTVNESAPIHSPRGSTIAKNKLNRDLTNRSASRPLEDVRPSTIALFGTMLEFLATGGVVCGEIKSYVCLTSINFHQRDLTSARRRRHCFCYDPSDAQ